jgi:hypothetical protein
MKSAIAAVAVLGATTWDPWSVVGQADSEASLLVAWGIALLLVSGRVRARLKSGREVHEQTSLPLQPVVAE